MALRLLSLFLLRLKTSCVNDRHWLSMHSLFKPESSECALFGEGPSLRRRQCNSRRSSCKTCSVRPTRRGLRERHGSRHDYNGCRRTRRHNNQQLTIKHKDLWLALGIWRAILKTRRRASPDVSLSQSSPDHAPPEQVIRRRKSTKDWSVVHCGMCAQQVIQSLIYLPRSFQYKILQK